MTLQGLLLVALTLYLKIINTVKVDMILQEFIKAINLVSLQTITIKPITTITITKIIIRSMKDINKIAMILCDIIMIKLIKFII